MGEFVSQSEFARRVGVTRQRVHSLIKEGRLHLVGKKGKRQRLDFEKSLAAYEATRDPSKPSKIAPAAEMVEDGNDVAEDGGWSFAKARRERETAAARRQKIKLAEEEGRLVSKKQVDADGFALGRIMRGGMQAWPSAMRERLAHKTPKAIFKILTEEVATLLAELEGLGAKVD